MRSCEESNQLMTKGAYSQVTAVTIRVLSRARLCNTFFGGQREVWFPLTVAMYLSTSCFSWSVSLRKLQEENKLRMADSNSICLWWLWEQIMRAFCDKCLYYDRKDEGRWCHNCAYMFCRYWCPASSPSVLILARSETSSDRTCKHSCDTTVPHPFDRTNCRVWMLKMLITQTQVLQRRGTK